MATLILIFLVLALFHFVLESTVLPSVRKEISFRLFAKRDELRMLKFDHEKSIGEDVYMEVQHSINVLQNIIPILDLGTVKRVTKNMDADPNAAKAIDKRIELLNNCKVEEIRQIHQKVTNYAFTAVLVNSIGWIVYLLPVLIPLIVILIISGFFNDIKKLFRQKINQMLYSEKTEINGLHISV